MPSPDPPDPAPRAPAPTLVFLALFAAMLVARGWVDERAYLALCGPALLWGPLRRWVALLALAHYLNPTNGQLSRSPLTSANHEYLEALLLVVVAIEPARDAVGRARLTWALRAIAVALVFIPGVQKLAHGSYPRGDFFALSYAERSKFATALDTLTSEAEREEAEAFRAGLVAFREMAREGVFDRAPPRPWSVTVASAVLCWATLLAELALPWLLLARRARLRRWGAASIIAFFLGVEIIALEWIFGGLVLCLLLPLLLVRDGEEEARPVGDVATWLLRAVLVVLWTWPCVHFYLTQRHDLSPWKLGGLAMYTVPARKGAEIVETRARGQAEWHLRLPRGVIERRRYEYAGYVLRNVPFAHAVAESLADAIRANQPAAAALEIRIGVTTVRWDRSIGRYRVTLRQWTFE